MSWSQNKYTSSSLWMFLLLVFVFLTVNSVTSFNPSSSTLRVQEGRKSSQVWRPTTATNEPLLQKGKRYSFSKKTICHVSELHVPGYRTSKIPFLYTEHDPHGSSPTISTSVRDPPSPIHSRTYTQGTDYTSLIPFESGHLLHQTTTPIFSPEECQSIINEAEYIASHIGWTTKRHGNYPTTDIPIVELPNTLSFFKRALVERIYPLLQAQFATYLPQSQSHEETFRNTDMSACPIRVVDGFIVKYDASGQVELKPHRDGSVLSFNIALNPSDEFDGGGTWFHALNDAIKIPQGHIVSHASGILHGGHGITRGKRYILVAFCIVEGYDSWSMRFYNKVRNC